MKLLDLLEVIQVQRHDFLNHLQVISGLLQLNKIDRARDYINLVNREIGRSSMTARVKIPEVTAALLSGLCEAARHQVEMDIRVNSRFDGCDIAGPVAGEALERCLAGAFRALAPVGVRDRRLEVQFDENEKNFVCRLSFQKPRGFQPQPVEEEIERAGEIAGPAGGRVKLALSEEKAEIFMLLPRKKDGNRVE
ncbi:MAG: Spo0B domain-containing protein [Peptococcaceae bacterium]|nr:Spo0B domain-containing protein [Peptococcaceae bacterium]